MPYHPPIKKAKAAKAIVQGVIGSGVATWVATGAMGVMPLVAFPVALAGAAYANVKSDPKGAKQNAKMWGVIGGIGVACAAVMNTFDMVPTASAVLYGMGALAPLATNMIKEKLMNRRSQSQGPVIETRPGEPDKVKMDAQAPSLTTASTAAPVNVAVPPQFADQVAKYVEKLQSAQPEVAQPESTPTRVKYSP